MVCEALALARGVPPKDVPDTVAPYVPRTPYDRGFIEDVAAQDSHVKHDDKERLRDDLYKIAEETKQFDPPYIPGRYLQDLANSDPAELVYKYVRAKDPTDGFVRLWQEKRLDLAVENVAWKHRHLFPPSVGRAAAARLAAADFDVRTQQHK
jgi:hypothetical protein